jgi:hypothetical protein
MGFTVIHQGGTKDSEFDAYYRLLRQQGVDLGKAPRVAEPGTRRRWLYVWDTKAKAQAFANELKKRTRDKDWEAVPAAGSPSEGPLGPLLIQLGRRGDGLYFALHTLSQILLRSAYPEAFGVSSIFLDREAWDDFLKARGDFAELTRRLAPTLTGLSTEQLEALGYAVIDDQSEETVVYVPPREAEQGEAG